MLRKVMLRMETTEEEKQDLGLDVRVGSSRAEAIPSVIFGLMALRPRSVLDVGIGFGKYGMLAREYLGWFGQDWLQKLDGVEAWEPYIGPIQRAVYDRVFCCDIREQIDNLPTYDAIIFADVIEHMPKEDGGVLLDKLMAHARDGVIVTTPNVFVEQDDVGGNPYQVHRSLWTSVDFEKYKDKFHFLLGTDEYPDQWNVFILMKQRKEVR